MMTRDPSRIFPAPVQRHTPDGVDEVEDRLAVEEPLEIQVRYGDDPPTTLAVVMRTPGDDVDLVTGFLLGEGVIDEKTHLKEVREAGIGNNRANIVVATLAADHVFDATKTLRFGITSSACGVCGAAAVDISGTNIPALDPTQPALDPKMIRRLPGLLRASQRVFASTGGSHAALLASAKGDIVVAREDVGRHFALDKVIGNALQAGFPMSSLVAVTSARASFELVQKCLRAGLPALVAVGPPTSLAVRTAAEHGLTLVGFASSERFNLYTGRARILPEVVD